MDLVALDTLTLAAGHLEDTVQDTLLAVDLKKRKIVRAVRRDARVAIDSGPQRGVPSDATRYQLRMLFIDLVRAATSCGCRPRARGSVEKVAWTLDVDVPDFSKGPPRLGPVLIGTVGAPPPTGESANAHGLLPFMPVLDRAFSTADTLRVFCPVLGAGDLRPDSVRLELVSPAGATLAAAAGDIHRAPGRRPAPRPVSSSPPPLIGVSPGAYGAAPRRSGARGDSVARNRRVRVLTRHKSQIANRKSQIDCYSCAHPWRGCGPTRSSS